MNSESKTRRRNVILGALVADAASLGLHWVYDQQRIREVAPDTPEFRDPTPADYEGVRGFYAHGKKRTGDFSHYGEQAMVLLRSLVANEGHYDKTHYENLFREHFGYGGDYAGYIDHPMRDTLDNIARAEHEALQRAEAIPFDGDENTRHRMITKVLSNVKHAQIGSEDHGQFPFNTRRFHGHLPICLRNKKANTPLRRIVESGWLNITHHPPPSASLHWKPYR